ncbi:MAG: UDP-N-acetylmuramate dehydrogenase [Ignavibacteriales bacterium]|nr:UDP-N-acetylmuramate dehydrogenase [Ignavibacteriales bacterium]
MNSEIKENILLSRYTTLQLGGVAKYFCSCSSVNEIQEALEFARTKNIRTHILGGGSNTVFSDEGFDGLVAKIDLKGISFVEEGNDVLVTAKGGEDWEKLVKMCVEKGYAGIECLSGIPGSVGATPIQNVGAYGQEVKDTIIEVKALDSLAFEEISFSNPDCQFSYRMSRFKIHDAGKYIITEVGFRLKKNGRPTINYPEVKKVVEATIPLSSLADGRASLEAVRNVVLSLRKKKSMVIDPDDPNTRSVGSFFMNPVVENDQFSVVSAQWKRIGDGSEVPSFAFGNKKKIPAAWLIEKSGFHKGYVKDGIGISENHTLALVNRGGTTAALLALANEIQEGVGKKFGIRLEREPVVID